MREKHKVIIARCDQYDSEKIATIIESGMKTLGIKPYGNVLLKPNVVIANQEMFPEAFTRSEFLDGAIAATKARAEHAKEIAVGERSGLILSTRYNFKNAGYFKVIKKHKVKAYCFDEYKNVPVKLNNSKALRKNLFIPKPVTDADFLINLPKFKAHPWTKMTLSLKNFIGIQDDRHRLVDHNSFLEHKIADLQEVIQPKFIAIDAISAGQKMMLTPTPFPMGAIVMGTNSCAVDTVGCHMVHVNPDDVDHLRYSSERGFGPKDLNEIEILGDYPLEEVQQKTKNFQFCLEHIDTYFKKGSKLRCTVGEFPEKHSMDYCWGGCPGALQEAFHIFRNFYPDVEEKMEKIRYVVGKVDGPLNLEPDEKVIFAGNCTEWEGDIHGEHVKIERDYRSTSQVDETKTKTNDMLMKVSQSLWYIFRNRKSKYLHMKSCPVSVADHIYHISALAKIKNPNFDSRVLLPRLFWNYFVAHVKRLLNGLF